MEDISKDAQQLADTVESIDEGMIKKWLNDLIPDALSFFLCVIFAFIVYIIGIKLIKLLRRMVKKALEVKNVDIGVRQFIDQIIKITGYVVLFITILNLFGVQTSSVAAAIASLGLTAGLALQGALSNFAGGILILILKPFVVGDYIMEHTHGNEGTVSEITIFYTKLNTVDHQTIVIPNGTLANSSMTNATNNESRHLDLVVPISYADDIRTAKKILKKIAEEESERVKNADITVFVKELGDSSINLGLRFWVPTERYWNIRWQTLEHIKYAFDEAGITIPFQSLEVNVHQAENS